MEESDGVARGSWEERARALAQDALSRAGRGTLTIAGREAPRGDRVRRGLSMTPLLAPGDAIFWVRSAKGPRFGDVVVFHEPAPAGRPARHGEETGPPLMGALSAAQLTVHRVVGTRRGGARLTKGDGRATLDAHAVPEAMIVGVVEAIRVRGRWRSLCAAGSRVYALGAAAISAAGHAGFVAAGGADRLIERVAPPAAASWESRLCVRRLAWWAQRAGQLAWHAALGRLCHPAIPAPADAAKPPSGKDRS